MIPAQIFGGNSDGGMRMEEWLSEMCRGCVRYDVEGTQQDDLPGMNCDLPALVYCDPHEDRPEWSADASPAGPYGITCMAYQRRPGCAWCGRTVNGDLSSACGCAARRCEGQMSLLGVSL